MQKDKAEYEFMNNPKKKVFIGQILASGVGITLTKSHICIFNSYSWVPSDNWQVMDRVHRLSQTEDVTVYYQLFDDDISLEMWEKVMSKEDIIKAVIKAKMKSNVFRVLTLKDVEKILSESTTFNCGLNSYGKLSPKMEELINSEILKDLKMYGKKKNKQ